MAARALWDLSSCLYHTHPVFGKATFLDRIVKLDHGAKKMSVVNECINTFSLPCPTTQSSVPLPHLSAAPKSGSLFSLFSSSSGPSAPTTDRLSGKQVLIPLWYQTGIPTGSRFFLSYNFVCFFVCLLGRGHRHMCHGMCMVVRG